MKSKLLLYRLGLVWKVYPSTEIDWEFELPKQDLSVFYPNPEDTKNFVQFAFCKDEDTIRAAVERMKTKLKKKNDRNHFVCLLDNVFD